MGVKRAGKPARLVVILPSWVGDVVMATPTLRMIRAALPGAFIGGLVRPGMDTLLAGTSFLDEVHVDHAQGMMGPKRVASKLRLRRYDGALLLTNSFSTALIARLAGIPRRWGYERDGRGVLLTSRLSAPKRRDIEPYRNSPTDPGAWAPIAACAYYEAIGRFMLEECGIEAPANAGAMELAVTDDERSGAARVLEAGGAQEGDTLVLLNPGGNNPAKRWPGERFAQLADWLVDEHDARVLLSGSPGERELTAEIAGMCARSDRVIDIPNLEGAKTDLGVLKGIVARCSLMVTNDTGPRHIAAALRVPVVSLFGPTDHRWTTIPFDRERVLVADPSLPEEEVANDHPERCAIERIAPERVRDMASDLLAGGSS